MDEQGVAGPRDAGVRSGGIELEAPDDDLVGALDDVVLGDPTVLGGALVGTGEIGTLVGDDVDGQMLPVVDGLPGEGSEGFP